MNIGVERFEDLRGVAEAISDLVNSGYRIILLYGEMGAGKTTLVKQICEEWGVMEPVNSPTFALVQEYESPNRGSIYHMDLYRLEKIQDLEQIGFEEYLLSGNICLIEWPDLGSSYYTMPTLWVEISLGEDNIRNFKITTYDAVDA
ncbi:MAG: tRNA (adenosine(37)-N6)-threonylcarbamoyltransferase complex ATPase subunit type 1 TsaE [Bacteroidota bacterium]|nr:tRNA (adenosine(37)-N6)-threonylcarbamoyltransferase complex ATPase subunit type 1 TsaE [Bacteroidota bacterium]